MANKAIKDIISASDETQNIFFGGLKVFRELKKSDSIIDFAMPRSGRNLLLDFMSEKRRLNITLCEMRRLLEGDIMESIDIKDVLNDISIEAIEKIKENNGIGPICFTYQDLNILANVGQYKITHLINKNEQYHAKLMLE